MTIISVELAQKPSQQKCYSMLQHATAFLLHFCPCHALCSSEETGDIWAITWRLKI